MTSGPHGPYGLGDTRATMAGPARCNPVTGSESLNPSPSSDWSLQPDSMKSESLVIADQPRRGEYVPGPCTHRPSSHGSGFHLKSLGAGNQAGAEGGAHDWG